MYASLATSQASPGTNDERIQAVRDGLLPVARQQKDFKGFLILVDSEGNRLLGITLWETVGDLQASEGAGGYYREQMARLGKFLEGTSQRDVYEVALLEMEE
jgi:hypothetical protein